MKNKIILIAKKKFLFSVILAITSCNRGIVINELKEEVYFISTKKVVHGMFGKNDTSTLSFYNHFSLKGPNCLIYKSNLNEIIDSNFSFYNSDLKLELYDSFNFESSSREFRISNDLLNISSKTKVGDVVFKDSVNNIYWLDSIYLEGEDKIYIVSDRCFLEEETNPHPTCNKFWLSKHWGVIKVVSWEYYAEEKYEYLAFIEKYRKKGLLYEKVNEEQILGGNVLKMVLDKK